MGGLPSGATHFFGLLYVKSCDTSGFDAGGEVAMGAYCCAACGTRFTKPDGEKPRLVGADQLRKYPVGAVVPEVALYVCDGWPGCRTATDSPRGGPTPGPWRVVREGGTTAVVGADGQRVCDDEDYYARAVSEADMVLIAASWELYQSGKRLSVIADQIYVQMSDGEANLLREAFGGLDAALAKAEGRGCS